MKEKHHKKGDFEPPPFMVQVLPIQAREAEL